MTSADSFRADIGVSEGRIVAIGGLERANATATFDANDLLVFPGFIDEHVHSRDPGATHKEDFAHSTRAAVAGGVTTVLEMPNSVPPVTDARAFEERAERLESTAFADFGLWGMTVGSINLEDLPGLAAAGVIGFKLFWGYALDRESRALVYDWTPGQDVIEPPDDGEVFAAMRAIAATGRVLALHAENSEVIRRLTADEKRRQPPSYAGFLRSRPPFTEALAVEAGCKLARAAGVRLHVLHLTSSDAAQAVARARREGVKVTGETCPHYLFLSDEDFATLGTAMKVLPPIRERHHQAALWNELQARRGIHAIGSDHAPHTEEEKVGDLWAVPAGAPSVQLTAPLLLDAAGAGRLTHRDVAALLAENPARIAGLWGKKGGIGIGFDADLTVVDPAASVRVERQAMLSKNGSSLYVGRSLRGRPVASFLRGTQVMSDGVPVGNPIGRLVRPVNDPLDPV